MVYVHTCATCLHALQTEQRRDQLPPAPASDPYLELSRRLRDLCSSVAAAVAGQDEAQFYRTVSSHYRQLRKEVLQARPTVQLTAAAAQPDLEQEYEQESNDEEPDFWLDGPGQTEAEGALPPVVITLDHMRKLAAEFRVSELPTFAPYRVLDELVKGLKGRWDSAASTCVRLVGEALQHLSDKLVDEHFGHFSAARHEVR